MSAPTRLATVEDALAALREGRPVLVVDDADRENEGDVVLAAQTLTEQWTAWAVRHTSGYLCAPVTEEVADRLDLPLMVADNRDPLTTAYTVTVDAAVGVTTGISAADRTRTARVLADPMTTAADLRRPGHLVPLRARDGGVLVRPGHTEAAVDLCRLAGLAPVGVIGELVEDDGSMTRLPGVLQLGQREGLPVLTIADLVAWRQRHDRVERVAETVLPTRHGQFRTLAYRDRITGDEHLALVSPRGVPHSASLVRVHSECLTGDVLGSQRCDCGPQLERSLERVAAEGGVVVYLRGHEGRGVGLAEKLRAYALQDGGLDTVDAQVELGLPVDARDYVAAAGILADLEVDGIRLLTNNPAKVEGLRRHGVEVTAVERLRTALHPANADYLRTKRDRLGHDLVLDAADTGTSA
ncbi:3,4-dihydroxy-2-butanone-4-phosphate synthase [Oryzobacter telluris]|uniref:3,4-dihydroxy-2-butanone-4-phosphate synthase n=1 Tax=Oryzobacter telluris TaxID=3149179 RepID=UPI00370D772A